MSFGPCLLGKFNENDWGFRQAPPPQLSDRDAQRFQVVDPGIAAPDVAHRCLEAGGVVAGHPEREAAGNAMDAAVAHGELVRDVEDPQCGQGEGSSREASAFTIES